LAVSVHSVVYVVYCVAGLETVEFEAKVVEALSEPVPTVPVGPTSKEEDVVLLIPIVELDTSGAE